MSGKKPKWYTPRIREPSELPIPCKHGDGLIKAGEWQRGFKSGNWYRVFHYDCSDLYDDEGKYDGGTE